MTQAEFERRTQRGATAHIERPTAYQHQTQPARIRRRRHRALSHRRRAQRPQCSRSSLTSRHRSINSARPRASSPARSGRPSPASAKPRSPARSRGRTPRGRRPAAEGAGTEPGRDEVCAARACRYPLDRRSKLVRIYARDESCCFRYTRAAWGALSNFQPLAVSARPFASEYTGHPHAFSERRWQPFEERKLFGDSHGCARQQIG